METFCCKPSYLPLKARESKDLSKDFPPSTILENNTGMISQILAMNPAFVYINIEVVTCHNENAEKIKAVIYD